MTRLSAESPPSDHGRLALLVAIVVVVVLGSGMFAAIADGSPAGVAPTAPARPSASAGNGSWGNFTANGTPPGLASGGAMAYDPTDGYLVLFGGCTSGNYWYSVCTPTNQTWVYQNGTWSQLAPAVSPPARFYSSLVWDPEEQSLVLFGGNGSASFLNDTWTFVGGTWTNVTGSRSPPARAGASMAYDARDGYVLLTDGERNRTLTNLATESYSGSDFNDSWAFSGGTWTQLHPLDNPTARDSASVAYDAGLGGVVLFGGFNWTTYNLQDTWVYAAGTWSLASKGPTNSSGPWPPSDRNGAAMAYDPAIGGELLFGGHSGYQFDSDTWYFNGSGWTPLLTGSNATGPSARWGSGLAYDPSYGCTILFGGYQSNGTTAAMPGRFLNDTWGFCAGGTSGNGSAPNGSSGHGTSGKGTSGGGTGAPGPASHSAGAGPSGSSPAAPARLTTPSAGSHGAETGAPSASSGGIWISPLGLAAYVGLSVGLLVFIVLALRRARRSR